MRHFLLVAAVGRVVLVTGQLAAALNDEIITEATAQRYGLTRMWVTQAQVDRGPGPLQASCFTTACSTPRSNRATLEAIDAETGQKLWSKMIGQPEPPSLAPAVMPRPGGHDQRLHALRDEPLHGRHPLPDLGRRRCRRRTRR